MENLEALEDFRYAVRQLVNTPGFTLIAIVTLGLGIGADTSMFSILNGYMLRPAPYADSDGLERIYRGTPRDSRGAIATADDLDLKLEINGFGEIATYGNSEMSLSEPGKPAEMVSALRISANLFSTLAASPQLGRSFRSDEETLGNHGVLIISHRYWQNRFGGDAHIHRPHRARRRRTPRDRLVSAPRKSATATPRDCVWSVGAPEPSPARRPKASSPTSAAASRSGSLPLTSTAPGSPFPSMRLSCPGTPRASW